MFKYLPAILFGFSVMITGHGCTTVSDIATLPVHVATKTALKTAVKTTQTGVKSLLTDSEITAKYLRRKGAGTYQVGKTPVTITGKAAKADHKKNLILTFYVHNEDQEITAMQQKIKASELDEAIDLVRNTTYITALHIEAL